MRCAPAGLTSVLAALATIVAVAQDGPPAAPSRYEDVILRLDARGHAGFANLRYEGNNAAMRGARRGGGATRPYEDDGLTIARRWRSAALATKGVFVLRDTLFSQQDHPLDHSPAALMLPPSWVSVAVAGATAGHPVTPMQVAAPEDDAGWAALDDARLFGGYPPSTRLSDVGRQSRAATTDPDARDRIAHARAALASLAGDVAALSGTDAAAVARAGAERIAASDRTYFDAARTHVIPIFVESPSEHEQRDEGKGFVPWGVTIPDASLGLTKRAVLAARLADGDMALERYDLTHDDDRRHVIALLEELVPEGHAPPGGTVWVWAHAGLVGDSPHAPDALPSVPRFLRELGDAHVETSRVVVLVRPSLELPGGAARGPALEAAVDRFHATGVPLSVHLASRAFAALLHPASR